VILRAGQRELLDLAALRQGEPGRAAAAVARVQRVEPVSVEVVQHVADPVLGREGHLGDLGTGIRWAASRTICARRQVTTEPLARRTIRNSRLPS
jgi:hypothetical protein